MSRVIATAAVLLLSLPAVARADVALSLRAGAGTVALDASSDTPFIGATFDDAITAYNGAAQAYNQAHGFKPGSAKAAPSRTVEDMSVDASQVTLAPALDLGLSYYRARIEVPLGLGELRTIGLAVYPLGVAFADERATAMPYLLAGGIASYVTDDTRTGALLEMRIAGRERIDVLMDTYDPRGSAPPPSPHEVVRGGTGGGAFDLALGFSL
jgi:hypothetical protein